MRNIEVIWWWLPPNALPQAALDACAGKVNGLLLTEDGSGDTTLPGWPPPAQYESGTLRLENYFVEKDWFGDGTDAIHVHYFFRRRRVLLPAREVAPGDPPAAPEYAGFDYILAPSGRYERIARNGNPNVGVFDAEDFSNLFVAGDL